MLRSHMHAGQASLHPLQSQESPGCFSASLLQVGAVDFAILFLVLHELHGIVPVTHLLRDDSKEA